MPSRQVRSRFIRCAAMILFGGVVAVVADVRSLIVARGDGAAVHAYEGLMTAYLAREIERNAAGRSFLVRMVHCLNDSGADIEQDMTDAQEDWAIEVESADERFEARYDALQWLGDGAYDPSTPPADFTANVTNNYFPLVPGRTLIHEGVVDGVLNHRETTTLAETRIVDDVECRVVEIVETIDGVLAERATEWYAEDIFGNVWCFGRSVRIEEDGIVVSLEGSWRAGVDGAKPGIVMKGAPAVGDAYRMEFALGVAEDYSVVQSLADIVTIAGEIHSWCRRMLERTPLDPDDEETKIYAPAVGLVRESNSTSGATMELIRITGN